MDSNDGGLSSSERQRQTAAEIARSKVIASYSSSNSENAKERTVSHVKQKTVTDEEWKKYHSAWQNYYQKYYSEYYANAAKQYVATEKLKAERRKNEGIEDEQPQTVKPSNIISSTATEPEEESIRENLRKKIREKAQKSAKRSRRHRRLIPIFAGIAVVLIILFLQYNRLIFAPIMAYVSPGNSTAEEIVAIDPTITQSVGPEPKLIIPKLNVNVPVHFGINSNDVMNAMNDGVAHYLIPGANAFPGQIGNVVITGHSAGDIYSNNQYKFIFSGLERLEDGDLIYINYDSTRYTYSVVKKETVEPSNVAAVTPDTTKPQLILVTCTPLGTSRYRLIVTAEQVSPSYADSPTQEPITEITTEDNNNLPSNEPSFFEKIWNWLTGQSNS